MRRITRTGALTAVVAVAGFAATADAAGAAVMRGTVVHRNARAHSFTLANRSGRLFAIHTAHAPRLGSQLQVTARRLFDGTFALQRSRVVGRAHRRVRVHGVVTHVNRRGGTFTLSAPGVSMLVHRGRGARAADNSPAVGDDVTATGNVDDKGDLDEQSATTTGMNTGGFSLEGTILSVDTTARTLSISGDDDDSQSAGTTTVTVPSAIDISQFQPGQEVELEVQRQADGSLMLLGSAEDENAQQANDRHDCQGDGGDGEDNGTSGHDGGSSTSTTSGGSDGGSRSGSDGGSGSGSDGGSGGDGGSGH